MRSDELLLALWRDGDRKAGNELFQRHFESVRRFFVNKVDRELEDLVQRTFLACAEGRDRFEGRSSFRTYVFAIARNILREHYRARIRADQHDSLDDVYVADLQPGPSTALARKREERLLLEGLRRIPLESQIILELYLWERLSGSQLGEILEIPENTARSRIARAKELLTRALTRITASRDLLESTTANLETWATSLRLQLDAPVAERE